MLKRFLILPNESIEHFHLGNFSTSSRLQNRLYGLLLQVPCEPIEGGDLLSQLRWNCSHSTFITSVEPHPNQTFLYTPTVFQNWLVGLYRGWHFLPSYIRIIIKRGSHPNQHLTQHEPTLAILIQEVLWCLFLALGFVWFSLQPHSLTAATYQIFSALIPMAVVCCFYWAKSTSLQAPWHFLAASRARFRACHQ